jgi:hypothetical protein
LISEADARIEDRIKDIDHQVDEHEEQHDDNQVGDDHRSIELLNGVDQKLTHARPGKDCLRHHRKRDQTAELQPEHGDHRDHDVFKQVQPDHPPRRQTLGTRELDVILMDRLPRSGPRQADHQRYLEQGKIEGGQEYVAQAIRGEETRLDAKKLCRWPRPVEGSQPSITAKIMINIRPTQNVGSEKPRIDPAMIARDE